jgi:acyl dehydratase
MRTFDGIDGLRGAVGTHLGYSSWLEIDQARVDAFADATDDHQWIHVDVGRATSGPFGTTIAHGFLTLALVAPLVWEVFRTEGLSMEINYGLNKVRFPAPALVPCRVRAGVELLSLESAGPGFMVKTLVTIESDGAAKPVCFAESLGYLVPA